ncbi:pectinacetylesterase family protein [Ectothiorhodospira variabilis]|uniref:pectinacetylesterase family protein n=1 Tax=Ectothiorhodospira variabilis TaxID=505694 RepID=UPI001EFBC30F|nr:pectinacetylesterase family protein [Ectothiorhodospira variabilis]MCG5495899.1 pectinacetylesterase family protein [Ectothiorhodospira variabilis]MCG5498398.1 pectinacetylesterase family protein [Ectothiorhodospira variabilis]MCG5503032.1 pectinacetylesterase family protein [Ectothiorhodospira variabilis]MCG5508457.1 pectinacetylesterase family protein [Ectothiorhodospira variabilis]
MFQLKKALNGGVLLLGFGAVCFAPAAIAGKPWQRIDVPDSMTVLLADGSEREVSPSCSGGPTLINPEMPPSPDNLKPADTNFAFFVQQGNPNRILFFMDGGGACWNAETCIGSPLIGESTYVQTVDGMIGDLANIGGVLDSDNPGNPFANYTKVFVPYCTGDIHFGTRDAEYELTTDEGSLSWTIHHRGVDNLLATIHMLNTSVSRNGKRLAVDFASAKDVTVTGLSAGGYGATLAFGYIAEETSPRTRLNLISDSAMGVQTDDFYGQVIYDGSGDERWGFADGLPSWVPAFSDPDVFLGGATGNALAFKPLMFQALGDYRPEARLASVSPNLDGVQIQFYAASLPSAQQPISPSEWYAGLQYIVQQTASVPNYRFFIEEGSFHTFLASDEHLYGVGALGVSLRDWINAMIKPGNRAWDSLDAGEPALQ